MKESSTGVLRPKILTVTFNFFFSSFISSIVPEKLLNGPSTIFTDSPIINGSDLLTLLFDLVIHQPDQEYVLPHLPE